MSERNNIFVNKKVKIHKYKICCVKETDEISSVDYVDFTDFKPRTEAFFKKYCKKNGWFFVSISNHEIIEEECSLPIQVYYECYLKYKDNNIDGQMCINDFLD